MGWGHPTGWGHATVLLFITIVAVALVTFAITSGMGRNRRD
jgi:hypothetical protein